MRPGETMKRIPRPLDPVERRVLGSLLEKEQATPDYYPLTLNALLAACNQKNNREPVTDLSSDDVVAALDRLVLDVLVWKREGPRAEKWLHNVERRWRVDGAGKAILTLLLLRGPQTPGELRARSARLHPFAGVDEVQAKLADLASGKEPLVAELARRPGQKESRWADLLSGEPEEAVAAAAAPSPSPAVAAPTAPPPAGLADRVAALEERVEELEQALESFRRRLGDAPP